MNQPLDFRYLSYSQMGEDRILRTFLFDELNITNGFYVDIGAFHPVQHSNSYWFYQLGWNGITVEPNPDAKEIFHQTRPRDAHLVAAVTGHQSTERFMRFINPLHSTLCVNTSSALCRQNPAVYAIQDVLEVPTFPLSHILTNTDTGGRTFAFLSVDVEGKDLEVLRSNDWTKFRPLLVVVEDHHFDFLNVSSSSVYKFLETVGYHLVSVAYLSLIFQRADTVRNRPGSVGQKP